MPMPQSPFMGAPTPPITPPPFPGAAGISTYNPGQLLHFSAPGVIHPGGNAGPAGARTPVA